MLISNNVLSKWNVALSLLSCSSAPSLTAFQPFHPPLWWGMWFHGLHLCLITATDGSLTGFLYSRHCSHSFSPFSYCQHTFTSKSMARSRLYLLLIPLHAAHMISAALFLPSLLPLQSRYKWGFGFDLSDFVLDWRMLSICLWEVHQTAFHYKQEKSVFALVSALMPLLSVEWRVSANCLVHTKRSNLKDM